MFIAVGSSLLWSFTRLPSGVNFARHITLVAQVSPFLLLAFAFIFDLQSLDLVSRYGGADLPILYRLSAVWGGRAGPLLLWAAIMGVITWIMSGKNASNSHEVRLMHGAIVMILLASWLLSPFAKSSGFIGTLNPLLQTDLMVIHPPLVFAYYSLCMAVSSIALAGLIERRTPEYIHNSMLHWARAGFLIGTIGIGLGGLWAYTVLDWGGYWAWDPVETGSILPWFVLLMIVHARARTDSNRHTAFISSPSLGMLSGALAIHATLVTRANGVWASVHSFVGNEEARVYDDPYIRMVQLFNDGVAGIEVAIYSIMMIILCIGAVYWMIIQQKNMLKDRGVSSLFDSNRIIAITLLLSTIFVGFWIRSTAVTLASFSLMLLLVLGEESRPPLTWVFSGVFLMLFASWTWTASISQAVVGMILFLGPWLISTDEEEINLLEIFTNTRLRMNLARAIPWFGAAAFLTLTWLLLTAEIDGTSLAAHEFYGAPILCITVLALTIYSWGKSVDSKRGNILMLVTLMMSVILSLNVDQFDLPGDPSLMLTSSVSRGALSMFMLTWIFIALPPTITQLIKTIRRNIPSMRKSGWLASNNSTRLRLLGSHIAHLGILLLLLGHVLTTTLVDRADPSHLITLEKGNPVELNGYELIFQDTVLLGEDDPDYPYDIGEGFAGFSIDIEKDGERVDQVTPGIIRFNFFQQRSEVDRFIRPSGDMIFILDSNQASISLAAMMSGDIDEINEIRVTVHDLQGSHIVWIGWVLIMLGGLAALLSSKRIIQDDAEQYSVFEEE